MSENFRSSGYHCVVVGCTNNFTKRKRNRANWCVEHKKQQGDCGCKIFKLHSFPLDPDLRRKWVASINRQDFVPSSSSRICSDHFIDGKRTENNPVPMLRLGYDRKVRDHFPACATLFDYLLCVHIYVLYQLLTRARFSSGYRWPKAACKRLRATDQEAGKRACMRVLQWENV